MNDAGVALNETQAKLGAMCEEFETTKQRLATIEEKSNEYENELSSMIETNEMLTEENAALTEAYAEHRETTAATQVAMERQVSEAAQQARRRSTARREVVSERNQFDADICDLKDENESLANQLEEEETKQEALLCKVPTAKTR